MSPALKKILLIVLLLLSATIIALGLYYFFNRTTQLTTDGQLGTALPGTGNKGLPGSGQRGEETGAGSTPGAGTLPQAGQGEGQPLASFFQPELVTKLTDDLTLYPSLSQAGNFRYHNAADGKFYRIGADGTLEPLSDEVFYNVKKVTWAKAQDKAVIEYPDKSKIVYNFNSKKQVTLPKHWEDFSFSPDSNQIAAKSLGLDPDNRWLVITNDDGTGTQAIESLGNNANKVMVDWSPSRQAVAFSRTGEAQGGDRQEVLLLGQNNENFKSLIVEGINFEPTWSPTGQKVLYSVNSPRSDFKPELWVVNSFGDSIGGERRLLQINTWAHKCTFGDDTTLFCAVPRDLPQGAGLEPALARDLSDDLYKIDLKTGLKTPIPLDKDYAVNSISYDAAKSKLFFTDSHSTGAFSVGL